MPQFIVIHLSEKQEPAAATGPFPSRLAALDDAKRLRAEWAGEAEPGDDVQQWTQNNRYGCSVFHRDGKWVQSFWVIELEAK